MAQPGRRAIKIQTSVHVHTLFKSMFWCTREYSSVAEDLCNRHRQAMTSCCGFPVCSSKGRLGAVVKTREGHRLPEVSKHMSYLDIVIRLSGWIFLVKTQGRKGKLNEAHRTESPQYFRQRVSMWNGLIMRLNHLNLWLLKQSPLWVGCLIFHYSWGKVYFICWGLSWGAEM